jgi:hypothetical protein
VRGRRLRAAVVRADWSRGAIRHCGRYAGGSAPSHCGEQRTLDDHPSRKLKARLLADPEVKAEYDALAREFKIAAKLRGKRSPDGAKRNPGE